MTPRKRKPPVYINDCAGGALVLLESISSIILNDARETWTRCELLDMLQKLKDDPTLFDPKDIILLDRESARLQEEIRFGEWLKETRR